MTSLAIQRGIAAVFLLLGGWCLFLPQSVLDLTVMPAWRSYNPIVPILMAAFGAQAVLAGLFAWTARFTRATFLVYGIALLPFIVFDYWAYAEGMITPLGLLDAVGNVIMLVLCYVGWRKAEA
jgi:hypothetical protein